MLKRRPILAALFALAGLSVVTSAAAQVQRNFPQNALRGALVVVAAPEITLNGKPARLAPGARIRNASNMVQMSAELTGARLLVHYTLDAADLVKEVWVLTPEEAAKRPWPATPQQSNEWVFDPIAQVWSRR